MFRKNVMKICQINTYNFLSAINQLFTILLVFFLYLDKMKSGLDLVFNLKNIDKLQIVEVKEQQSYCGTYTWYKFELD